MGTRVPVVVTVMSTVPAPPTVAPADSVRVPAKSSVAPDEAVNVPASVTLDVPCAAGGVISWCTSGSASNYGLYRNLGTTCSSSNAKFIRYLTTGNIFWYDPQWTGSLAKLHVDLKVNVRPTKTVDLYELCDGIVLRNSQRVGSQGTTIPSSPAAPC